MISFPLLARSLFQFLLRTPVEFFLYSLRQLGIGEIVDEETERLNTVVEFEEHELSNVLGDSVPHFLKRPLRNEL